MGAILGSKKELPPMTRQTNVGKLSTAAVKNAKPKEKPYKLFDGGGLYLLIRPNGSRYWQLKYRISAKEKTLSFGVYPLVSLAEARAATLKAKELLRQNHDPSLRKQAKHGNSHESFQAIALEWWEKERDRWSTGHAESVKKSLETDAFPHIGHMHIDKLNAQECLLVIRKIEARGSSDVAGRVKQRMSAIFRYAIYTGYTEKNPVDALKDVIKYRKVQHRAALPIPELPKFLKAVETSEKITAITRHALQLLVLTFVRPGELRTAEWSEINFDKKEWRIPAAKMKMKEEHIVPLSDQAIDILNSVKTISGKYNFVFPGYHDIKRPMCENTLTYAIRRRLQFDATAHGFRTVASTMLNEAGFRSDFIERQLAHGERNKVRAAYNQAQYLQDRRNMMQWWADHVEQLKTA